MFYFLTEYPIPQDDTMYSKLSFFNTKLNISSLQVERFLKFRSVVFHLLTFIWHAVLNYHTGNGIAVIFETRMDIVNVTCGLGFQYITVWNNLIQQIYFNVCLLEDILAFTPDSSYVRTKQTLNKMIRYMFASCVFPMAFVILINFWSIYPIKRDIIDEYDVTATYFPHWVNHGLHTNIVFLVLVEKFLVYRKYPSKMWGFAGFTAIMASYFALLVVFNFISGFWPYPIFRLMNNLQRFMFFVFECLFGFFIFVVGERINRKIWGKRLSSHNVESNTETKNKME